MVHWTWPRKPKATKAFKDLSLWRTYLSDSLDYSYIEVESHQKSKVGRATDATKAKSPQKPVRNHPKAKTHKKHRNQKPKAKPRKKTQTTNIPALTPNSLFGPGPSPDKCKIIRPPHPQRTGDMRPKHLQETGDNGGQVHKHAAKAPTANWKQLEQSTHKQVETVGDRDKCKIMRPEHPHKSEDNGKQGETSVTLVPHCLRLLVGALLQLFPVRCGCFGRMILHLSPIFSSLL